MSQYIQSNYIVTLADAAYTVLESDSGKTLLIGALGGARIITLPAPKMGLHYRFMAINTLGNTATLTPSGGALMTGSAFNHTVVAVPVFTPVNYAAAANVVMTAACVAGDYCDLTCNGVIWYVSAIGRAVSFA